MLPGTRVPTTSGAHHVAQPFLTYPCPPTPPPRDARASASARLPGGAHELGQNLLVDTQVIRRVVDLVPDADRPVVEWAAGRGALTLPLARLGRPLEAVEIDPCSTERLNRVVPENVTVTRDDILRHAPPSDPYDLVCNVPFHLTTPVLRRLFTLPGWQRAVLITQWEVARKRAAVGGTTLLTAQWWPWLAPRLDRRIPAGAFRPRPSVDAGLLVIDRRSEPLLPVREQRGYQRFAAAVFNGPGPRAARRSSRGRASHGTTSGGGRASTASARARCPVSWTPAHGWARTGMSGRWPLRQRRSITAYPADRHVGAVE